MKTFTSGVVVGIFSATLFSTALAAQSESIPVENLPTRWELDAENLHASDLNLLSSAVFTRFMAGAAEGSATLGYNRLEVDYEPVRSADVIGRANDLTSSTKSAQVQASLSMSPFSEYWMSAGYYDGFTNHSSIWLDEYYRQQFSLFEGYVPASPWGYNLGAGVVHDFGKWPGVFGVALSYSQDDVAPGYDRPLFQDLERGRERLHTGGLTLSLESVPFARVRVRHELSLSDVTDRDLRWNYRGNVNVALAEDWVARGEATFTAEESQSSDQNNFRAESVALTLERDWNQVWFLSAHVRGYQDNGQIETSILVSASPPPLETTQWGVALRRKGERWSWKLGAAQYRTRFDEIDSPIRPFGNLYRDRDWVLFDATLSLTL